MMDIPNIRLGLDMIDEGLRVLAGGPRDYYIRTLCDCYEYLLTLAPHQVGSRVRLLCTPEISESRNWGWLIGKSFLKQGAVATVREIYAYGDGFRYLIEFPQDPGRRYTFRANEIGHCENPTEWIGPDGHREPW